MSSKILTRRIANQSSNYSFLYHSLNVNVNSKVSYSIILSRKMSSTGPAGTGRETAADARPTGQSVDPKDASQIRGHAVWIKGMAEEMVGKVSGAESWTQSGHDDKTRGVNEMRLAKEEGDKKAHYENRSPTVLNVEGTGEKVAGYMTGYRYPPSSTFPSHLYAMIPSSSFLSIIH